MVARHELGGRIRPVAYQLPGGSPVKIDCVTDERQAASLKSGGQGTRYTCKVTVDEVQSDVYLFHDEELWFMEAIPTQGVAPGIDLRTCCCERRDGRRVYRRTRRRGDWGWMCWSIVGWRAGVGLEMFPRNYLIVSTS